MLERQLDLHEEASNLDRFRANFDPGGDGEPLVVFPAPMWPWVSEAVLVESFVEGQPMLQWAAKLPQDAKVGRRGGGGREHAPAWVKGGKGVREGEGGASVVACCHALSPHPAAPLPPLAALFSSFDARPTNSRANPGHLPIQASSSVTPPFFMPPPALPS